MTFPEPTRHVVVFDCNVYLDVAELLGEPFTQAAFQDQAVAHAKSPLPYSPDHRVDSLRALAVCQSGWLVGREPLEVWTSDHIDDTIIYKARQSRVEDPVTKYRGLGWAQASAEAIVSDLVGPLTAIAGGSAGFQFPSGNPPLSHEDGCVFGTSRWLAGEDLLCMSYCVTNDRGFLEAYEHGELGVHTKVMRPARFVQAVRQARAKAHMPRPAR